MSGVDAWWAGGEHLTLSAGDHRIFVRDEGSGPRLVLLHGFTDSSLEWAGVWPALVEATYSGCQRFSSRATGPGHGKRVPFHPCVYPRPSGDWLSWGCPCSCCMGAKT